MLTVERGPQLVENATYIFLFYLYSGGWNQGPLDTAATNGLLCQPLVIMMMEKLVE
jgi:hypothetical protein